MPTDSTHKIAMLQENTPERMLTGKELEKVFDSQIMKQNDTHMIKSHLTHTVAGTTLAVITLWTPNDYLHTVIIALLGASVSFGWSLLLNWIKTKIAKKSEVKGKKK